MTHLIVVVEGQTEEEFVKQVLAPHLQDYEVYARATIVGKVIAQRRGGTQRGGGRFRNWRRDIERLLEEDRKGKRRVTTLFDLYGLPDDFPGLDAYGADADTNRRCDALQAALASVFEDRRLIPYLQRHELEALVLGALPALRQELDAEDDLVGLSKLEQEISGLALEDINDGRDTAPSKRLLRHIPGYRKVLHGPPAIANTGLATLRARCPRFDAWVTRLETLT